MTNTETGEVTGTSDKDYNVIWLRTLLKPVSVALMSRAIAGTAAAARVARRRQP